MSNAMPLRFKIIGGYQAIKMRPVWENLGSDKLTEDTAINEIHLVQRQKGISLAVVLKWNKFGNPGIVSHFSCNLLEIVAQLQLVPICGCNVLVFVKEEMRLSRQSFRVHLNNNSRNKGFNRVYSNLMT